jgi:hypothetical protein
MFNPNQVLLCDFRFPTLGDEPGWKVPFREVTFVGWVTAAPTTKCTLDCGAVFHMTGGHHRNNCPAYEETEKLLADATDSLLGKEVREGSVRANVKLPTGEVATVPLGYLFASKAIYNASKVRWKDYEKREPATKEQVDTVMGAQMVVTQLERGLSILPGSKEHQVLTAAILELTSRVMCVKHELTEADRAKAEEIAERYRKGEIKP